MKYVKYALFVLFICCTTYAGELSPELQNQISAKNSDDVISVWIKLPDAVNTKSLKSNQNSLSSTRKGRYEIAVESFKTNHQNSQQALIGKLEDLKNDNKVVSYKPHWIANIIEVDLKVSELSELASRHDVEIIHAVPIITLITPEKSAQIAPDALGVEANLTFINADDAWAAGYTGAGRVVCSFDSGVDGMHPALFSNWKGHNGDSAAAWFDPRDQEPFPHVPSGTSPTHGTHTTGIMVGHDDATGDTVGVALDAKWIAAGVIDVNGASIIDAFEWAADPDGDPNSIDDLPDVINHSWGVQGIGCQDVFYTLIDNLEALGIVNIFAAGNEGTQTDAIRNPANRALDSIDCFAVGNCYKTFPLTIYGSSSRGPSDCNGAIKPNVVAPGYTIRSSVPGGTYASQTGTSMAAPHVSGLVAILRQKNPNATVDEIKTAILTSAVDGPHSLPDNTYGWGAIDCMAALNALSASNTTPNVRLYAFDHLPISPGDIVAGKIILQNLGSTVANVTATITGSNPALSILDGIASFGTLNEGDTLRSSDSIKVIVSDTITEGTVLSLDFQINGTGYSEASKLYFVVEPKTSRMIATHNNNRVQFSVSNFGTYGMGVGSFFQAGGVGFKLDGSNSYLYESGLMIIASSGYVSDGVRCAAVEPDGDFRVKPGGNLQLLEPGFKSPQETYSIFSDERAENPIGISIVQQSFSYEDAGYDNLVIMRYIISNDNAYPLSLVRIGLYCDWDVISYSVNAGGWNSSDSVLWTAYNNGSAISNYNATKVLDGNVTSAYTADESIVSYGDGLTESEKAIALTNGFGTANTYTTGQNGLFQLLTAGPMLIPSGESDTVAFAIIGGTTYADLVNGANAASAVYDSVIANCCEGVRGNLIGDMKTEGITVADIVYLVNFLWKGGPEPPCWNEANVNASTDMSVNVADAVYMVRWLWQGGAAPPHCKDYQ